MVIDSYLKTSTEKAVEKFKEDHPKCSKVVISEWGNNLYRFRIRKDNPWHVAISEMHTYEEINAFGESHILEEMWKKVKAYEKEYHGSK